MEFPMFFVHLNTVLITYRNSNFGLAGFWIRGIFSWLASLPITSGLFLGLVGVSDKFSYQKP